VHQQDGATHESSIEHGRAWKLWIAIFVCAVCAYITIAEVVHYRDHEHFVLYGVHLDVRRKKAIAGIGGKYCWYTVDLSNYGLAPIKVRGFSVESDDGTQKPEFQLPYRVERWDSESRTWRPFSELDPSRHPDVEAAEKTVRPGSSVSVVPGIILGFRDGLQNGDSVRFAVFQREKAHASENAFYSNSFKIGESPDCN